MNLYQPLSTKAKEAIKLGLSMLLVYAIAMQMGWESPFWAALTVATASEVPLSDEVYENLYLLLGAYRAVSEALVDYSSSVEHIEWRHWNEARF